MICGIWNRGAREAEGLERMLAALPGRETDALGRLTDASIAFGCRSGRVGEERAESPHLDAASGLAVTATARLDGRAGLCETLGMPKRDSAALSDATLILKAYARWGGACAEHLLGDYAFALWDAKQEVLFCARDHIGVRPFYYAFEAGRFVFASDIAAVLAAPGVSGDLDEAAVATRLTYGARPLGARTCYRAVRRLLPGHALRIERGRVRVHRWWRPDELAELPAASDDAAAEECREILLEAVRDRVQDSRPVGVHLSGGLDSSAVAVLAARELRRQGRPSPPAFAWFPPPGSRENAQPAEYGRIAAVGRQEALRVFYRHPEARDVASFLRRDGTREADPEPHEESVRRAAAGLGVEIILSGFGGDQGISFHGRGYHRELLRSGRVGALWRELGERSRRTLVTLLAEALADLLYPVSTRAARRLRRGQWPYRKNVTFIHPGFARRVRPLPAEARPPRAGMRDLRVHFLQRGHLTNRLEGWAASGARHGIEYRYPLLDRRVLEFALRLPPEQYRRGRWSRWLMRRALDPVLPPEVCWNSSKGDPEPMEWLVAVIADALPAVRGMIEERPTPPSRARYLDMPRLLAELDPERWRATGRYSPVVNALRFLDF